MAEAKMDFRGTLDKAASAVAQNFKALPFERLEQCLADRYGTVGVKLAGVLWEASKAEERGQKRASAFKPVIQDYSLSPFCQIDRFVKAALTLQEKGSAMERVKEAAPPDPFAVTQPEKQAALPFTMGLLDKTTQGLIGLSDRPQYNAEFLQSADKVDDPNTRDQLRSIKVQTLIAQLQDDPVIAKQMRDDPDRVIQTFNELAEIAPDAIDKPMVARPILRRALQQDHLDPYDVTQFMQSSKGVKENTPEASRKDMEARVNDPYKQREDLAKNTAGSPAQYFMKKYTDKSKDKKPGDKPALPKEPGTQPEPTPGVGQQILGAISNRGKQLNSWLDGSALPGPTTRPGSYDAAEAAAAERLSQPDAMRDPRMNVQTNPVGSEVLSSALSGSPMVNPETPAMAGGKVIPTARRTVLPGPASGPMTGENFLG
jgi:hypothetical protein